MDKAEQIGRPRPQPVVGHGVGCSNCPAADGLQVGGRRGEGGRLGRLWER